MRERSPSFEHLQCVLVLQRSSLRRCRCCCRALLLLLLLLLLLQCINGYLGQAKQRNQKNRDALRKCTRVCSTSTVCALLVNSVGIVVAAAVYNIALLFAAAAAAAAVVCTTGPAVVY